MNEIARADDGVRLVNPATGELVGPDSDDATLAALIEVLEDAKRALDNLTIEVSGWVAARMDHDRSWTRHVPSGTLTMPSPSAGGKWNLERLRNVLASMLTDGQISQAAFDAAIVTKTTTSVSAAGVEQILRGATADEASLIRGCKAAAGVRRAKVER